MRMKPDHSNLTIFRADVIPSFRIDETLHHPWVAVRDSGDIVASIIKKPRTKLWYCEHCTPNNKKVIRVKEESSRFLRIICCCQEKGFLKIFVNISQQDKIEDEWHFLFECVMPMTGPGIYGLFLYYTSVLVSTKLYLVM